VSDSVFSYPNSDHKPAPGASQTTQQPAPAQPPQERAAFSYPNSDHKPAERPVDDGLSDAARAAREERKSESFYSAQGMYRDVLPAAPDATPEQKQAIEEWREVVADWQASSTDVRELVNVVSGLNELPTEETVAGWERDAKAELHRTFGKDADKALADAQALVARDPRVAQFLAVTGLGSHPRFVATLARLARSQRASGRLKRD
jgi:hypothetical protein